MNSRAIFTPGLVCVLMGCGYTFKAVNPDQFQVASDLKASLDQIFNTDSSFAPKPQDWIGRVGVVHKVVDPNTHNQTCSPKGTVEWMTHRVGDPSTLQFNEADQTKRLKFKSVINQSFAAKVDVMKYLSSELTGDTIFKIVLTEVAKQRYAPGEKWTNALTKFQTDHKAEYFEPENICYVVVVAGYTYNLLTREKFVKIANKTGAGYAGVNVAGEYYSTTEEFALDDVFTLSLEILRRPPTMGGGDGVAKTEAQRKVTDSDHGLLLGAAESSKQQLGAWQPGTP